MPREATITFEQVSAIAEALKAKGDKPTPRAILAQHGTGSLGTIHKLFKQWEGGQQHQTATTISLPPALQKILLEFVGQEITNVKAALETELSESQQQGNDLARENERQASEIEDLLGQIAELKSEISNVTGQLSVMEGDLANSRAEAERERKAAEAARTDLAKAVLQLEAMPRLQSDIDGLRDEIKRTNEAREQAVRELAVSRSQVKSMQEQLEAMPRLQNDLDGLRDEIKRTNEAREQAVREMAVNRSQVNSMQEQLEAEKRHSEGLIARLDEERTRMQQDLKEVRAANRDANLEIGSLKGQLAELTKTKAVKQPGQGSSRTATKEKTPTK